MVICGQNMPFDCVAFSEYKKDIMGFIKGVSFLTLFEMQVSVAKRLQKYFFIIIIISILPFKSYLSSSNTHLIVLNDNNLITAKYNL